MANSSSFQDGCLLQLLYDVTLRAECVVDYTLAIRSRVHCACLQELETSENNSAVAFFEIDENFQLT